MSEQANERMIRGLYDAFGRGDIQTILNLLADDVTGTTQGRRRSRTRAAIEAAMTCCASFRKSGNRWRLKRSS
jgi:ketosteroid isomerase-like protein